MRAPLRLFGAGVVVLPAGADAGAATAAGADDWFGDTGSDPRFGLGTLAGGNDPTATPTPDGPTADCTPVVTGGPEGAVTGPPEVTGGPAGTAPEPAAGGADGAAIITEAAVGAT